MKRMEETKAPMMEHLEELRKRLIRCAAALLVATVIVFLFFEEDIAYWVTEPFTSLDYGLNFMALPEGFLFHIKLSVLGGCVLACPVIIWEILRFVLPALYRHEKKIFFGMLFSGIFLFVAGVVFGYFFVLQLCLKALINFAGDLTPMISASAYVSFVMGFLIPFGLIFEVPMIVYFLTMAGVLNPGMMKKNRKYVLLVVLVIAALLTPPDIISQLCLALPMLLLYEFSIWLSRRVYKRKLKKQAKQQEKEAQKEMKKPEGKNAAD